MKAPTICYYHCHQARDQGRKSFDQEREQENSLSEHLAGWTFSPCTPGFQEGKSFVLHLCTLPNQGSHQHQRRVAAAAEMGLIFCRHPRQQAGWASTLVSPVRTSSPALASPLLNTRVLHSRGAICWPKGPGCLFWTPAAKQQNSACVISHLPRLTPLQQGCHCPRSQLHPTGEQGLSRGFAARPTPWPQYHRKPHGFSQVLSPFNLQQLRKGLPSAEEPPSQDRAVSMLHHTQICSVISCYKCKCIVRTWERKVVWFLMEISLIIN